jgi:hypothetical protein
MPKKQKVVPYFWALVGDALNGLQFCGGNNQAFGAVLLLTPGLHDILNMVV